MAWFQKTAGSLDDAAIHLAKQSQELATEDAAAEAAPVAGGVMVAPGVRFSERLWTRLGVQTREIEKQKRRERLSESTAFPEIPTSLFDATFRRDAIWKQRELRLRKAYVEHLESIALQRDVEKEVLQEKLVEQVSGVYKLAEDDAVQKLSAHIKDLQTRTYRVPMGVEACQPEREVTLQCYNANSKNPLVCATFVAAFEQCANQARMEVLRKKALQSQK